MEMIERIAVATLSRQYQVWLGRGLLDQSMPLREVCGGRQILVLSNQTVAPLYLQRVLAHLDGFAVQVELLPDGEIHKSWDNAGRVLTVLASIPASRDVTIIALGGGVIGDLAGFVAATYMRGVRFVQLPTTLLAMVDSSVGGKTAVNLPAGKNLAGAFWQPARVLIDPDVLSTLPKRELCAGLAEVLKYGAIRDRGFFDWLLEHADALLACEPAAVQHAIAVSVRHKAEVVAADETEQGERALLNFGHTFGHAIEAAQQYCGLLHGEAVAVGMLLAARMSERLGHASATDTAALHDLLLRLGLPVAVPAGLLSAQLLALMRGDKKNQSGRIRLILWNGVGQARLPEAVDEALIASVLDAATAGY
jgi:3-dehydroquinate synthase